MSKRPYGVTTPYVFVTDTLDGTTFEVVGEGTRPCSRDRTRFATAVSGVSDGDYTLCEVTGVTLAATAHASTVVLSNGSEARLASVAADRAVNDDPTGRFVVLDTAGKPSRVGYSFATVIGIDPALNGSSVRQRHLDDILDAARRRLEGWGEVS